MLSSPTRPLPELHTDARVVLVHQMGKVGSRTLVSALEKLPQFHVLHVHQLNPETLETLKQHHHDHGLKIPPHVYEAERVHRDLIEPGKKLEIVTVVREPVARNFSAFFQNLDFFDGCNPSNPAIPVEHYIRQFLDNYAHHVPLHWFDQQVKLPLGIDVYGQPFPHAQGYQIIEHDGHRLLILRCESSDETKIRGLNAFLGTHLAALPHVNVGDNKTYSKVYQAFKKQIRLPEAYVDDLLGSRFALHFYTADELASYRAKWLSPPQETPAAPTPAARQPHAPCFPISPGPIELAPLDKPADWVPAAVLVHQMGKVGSQTVAQSLEALGRWPVYQTHMLRGLEGKSPAAGGRHKVPPHISRAAEAIDRHLATSQPVAVITLVREPLARNVSSFFQTLGRYGHPRLISLFRGVAWCRRTFLRDYNHSAALTWFDAQFRAPFGVDVFSFPFPHERGWIALRKGERRFLILRVELADAEKERVIADFLGLPRLTLATKNTSDETVYGGLYRRFCAGPGLPAEYADRILSSKLARHFYTDAERAAARAQWTRSAP